MSESVDKKDLVLLEKGYDKAQQLLQDQDKVERFLQKLENKLRTIPGVGGTLAELPVFASLLNSYVKKEYTDIPLGSIIAIVSTLLYFVSPADLIPDIIPGIGHLDDAAVAAVCLKLVESDLKEYTKWRINTGRVIEINT